MERETEGNGRQTELVCLLKQQFFHSEVWEKKRLHTNEAFVCIFLTQEDIKSSILFSPTAIRLWMSEAEMESMQNLNNDLNEVISVEGIHSYAIQYNECPTNTQVDNDSSKGGRGVI